MHELVRVWTEKRGLFWITISVILYALLLIPFNQLQWVVAGISIRPAAAFPVLFGILWGPAAAWGLSIGNVAGDFYGSWSPMSIFGAIVNFLYPYLSYRLWHRWMKGRGIRADRYSLGGYLAVAFVATFVCMALLAACGTIFFSRPFNSKFLSYFGNNILWAITVGAALFWFGIDAAVRKGWVYGKEWERGERGREAN